MSSRTILDIGRSQVYAPEHDAKKEIAMLYALLALIVPLWSDSRDRTAAQREATASVSRLLVFVAAALFVILSILIVDLHRDELRALGLVGDAGRIDAVFMSP